MTILLARMVFLLDMRLSERAETVHRHKVDDARGTSQKDVFRVFDSVIAITDGPMVEFRARDLK